MKLHRCIHCGQGFLTKFFYKNHMSIENLIQDCVELSEDDDLIEWVNTTKEDFLPQWAKDEIDYRLQKKAEPKKLMNKWLIP